MDRNSYETPWPVFSYLNRRYHFAHDLAASHTNYRMPKYFTKDDDALSKNWADLAKWQWLWLNPPYGNLKEWMIKVQDEAQKGARIVTIVPMQTQGNVYFDRFFPRRLYNVIGRISFEYEGKPVHGNRDGSIILEYEPGLNMPPAVEWIQRDTFYGDKA